MWKFFTNSGAEKRTPALIVNPMAKIQANAVQSMPTGAPQALSLPTVVYDTDGMTSVASKITIQHAGRYLLEAYMAWLGSATGNQRQVWFQINGVPLLTGKQSAPFNVAGGGQLPRAVTSTVVALNVGDTVEAVSFQDSGAALNSAYNVGADIPELSVTKIDGAVVSYVGVPGSLVGQELAYAETTVTVNPSGTTFATATTIITAPAITCDGTSKINIEFSASYIKNPNVSAGDYMDVFVYEDGTQRARLVHWEPGVAGKYQSGKYSFEFIPTAGVHTYSIRGLVNQGSGSIAAGNGTLGNDIPANIRITRAA